MISIFSIGLGLIVILLILLTLSCYLNKSNRLRRLYKYYSHPLEKFDFDADKQFPQPPH